MSWGERSCYWLYEPKKPCTPTIHTCNVRCKHYQSNGKEPDSTNTVVDFNKLFMEHLVSYKHKEIEKC